MKRVTTMAMLHPTTSHVVDLLPAYALVALPDADLRRVESHLGRCAECRAAFDLELESVAAAADEAPPRTGARAEFLARTGGLRIIASPDADAAPVRLLPPAPEAATLRPPSGHRLGFANLPPGGFAWRAIAAAVLVMALPIAGWVFGVKSQIEERDLIYALVTNPAAAHPLNHSDFQSDVSGVLYADPDDNLAYIAASGLPPIPADLRYQVWLMTPAEEMISAGFLDVSANGDGAALLTTPEPVGDYLVAVVTPEPERGSPAPTGPRTLGGWISG